MRRVSLAVSTVLLTVSSAVAVSLGPATASLADPPGAGEQVEGTFSPATAPEIGPGLYRDVIGAVSGPFGTKYYQVRHTPGATLYVSATARPPAASWSYDGAEDGFTVTITTLSGELCDARSGVRSASALGFGSPMTALAVAGPRSASPRCLHAGRLIVRLERGYVNGPTGRDQPKTDVELTVAEEPAVEGVDRLPGPVGGGLSDRPASFKGELTRVEGGEGFSDAAYLGPGVARDRIGSGELRVYRIPLRWGQSAAISVQIAPDTVAVETMLSTGLIHFRTHLYSPVRGEILHTEPREYIGSEPVSFDATVPEIRYRNREKAGLRAFSVAGSYFVAVEAREYDGDYSVPLQIAVDVEGEAATGPEYVSSGSASGLADREEGRGSPEVPRDSENPGDTGDGEDRAAAPEGGQPGLPRLGLAVGSGVLFVAGIVLALSAARRSHGHRPGPSVRGG